MTTRSLLHLQGGQAQPCPYSYAAKRRRHEAWGVSPMLIGAGERALKERRRLGKSPSPALLQSACLPSLCTWGWRPRLHACAASQRSAGGPIRRLSVINAWIAAPLRKSRNADSLSRDDAPVGTASGGLGARSELTGEEVQDRTQEAWRLTRLERQQNTRTRRLCNTSMRQCLLSVGSLCQIEGGHRFFGQYLRCDRRMNSQRDGKLCDIERDFSGRTWAGPPAPRVELFGGEGYYFCR